MATKTESTNIVKMQEKMFDMECRIKKAESPEVALCLFEQYQKLSAQMRTMKRKAGRC